MRQVQTQRLRRVSAALDPSGGGLLRAAHRPAEALEARLGDAEFTEFVLMAKRARQLILADGWRRGAYQRALDEYRRQQILRCELKELRRELDTSTLDRLRRQNELLEREIRDLIRRETEDRHG